MHCYTKVCEQIFDAVIQTPKSPELIFNCILTVIYNLFNLFTFSKGRYRFGHRNSDDNEMSDEEFLEYIHQNDRSRHQLTSIAHDRYCHKIIKEKEEILLSSLNLKDLQEQSSDDDFHFGANGTFFDLLPPKNKFSESVSMPSSPVENKNFLRPENITRRKSDTEAASPRNSPIEIKNDNEYILTLKIDNLAADVEDISFFRIGPKHQSPQECSSQGKYELTESKTDLSDCEASNNLDATKEKMNQCSVQYREMTSDTCRALKKLLIGSASHSFFSQWFRQCFSFSHIPISRWQLVQVKVSYLCVS